MKQSECGTTVEEITRKMGITVATFYRWQQKFGGLMPSEVRKLKAAGGRGKAIKTTGCRL